MPVSTTYPGVYITEVNSVSVSISTGATAVPAIAYGSSDPGVSSLTGVKRFSSWLEFLNTVGTFNGASNLHISVRAYFENGGGYFYAIPTANLQTEVPKYDDITLLVAAGEDITTAAAALCQAGQSLFAILDGPTTELTASSDAPNYSANQFMAVYYPWLNADYATKQVPPSAPVAGAYNLVDRTQGVWKTPANVQLMGGLTPQFSVTDEIQGKFNGDLAINMIREFRNIGVVIYGGRTLENTDLWRYVAVRRFFNAIEKDIKTAMSAFTFEPNSQPTWERVRSAIESYLYSIWQKGGLAGKTEAESYQVKIGLNVTMTDADVAAGKMIAQVAVAAVRPAEFIVVEFSQQVGMG